MIGSIITVGLQLLSWFLERAKVKKEILERFYAFAEKLGSDMSSAKLREWGFKQLEELKNKPWAETK